jgi:non-heme chloroperoxidase
MSTTTAATLASVPAWHQDFRQDLTQIDVPPTLVIQGDADRIVPIGASALRTAKLIQGARLLVVQDGPPCITWTHTDEVNRELVSFLGESRSKSAGDSCRLLQTLSSPRLVYGIRR